MYSTKHTKDRDKGLMLTGLMSALCGFVCFVYFVVLMCATATARTAAAADNPYQGIVERNVFGLKPPAPAARPEDNKPPPPKIFLTGITTILGNKRALMKMTPPVSKPGEQPKEQSFTLAEGERDGELEVLEINEKEGTVKVNNYGTVATIDFDSNGVKTPTAPPPGAVPVPGVPPAMRPGLPAPPAMGGPNAMPNRPLRGMPVPAAPVTPQASVGGGGMQGATAQAAAEPQGSSSLEENLMMLEINRIKNQPLVEAGLMPPLPTHPLSEDMRNAIIGQDQPTAQVATPQPIRLPLPPGGAQQLPLTQ
jgi:hypothetical protein